MKYIRMVVTHVPTGKGWFTKRSELTKEVDESITKWQEDIITGRQATVTILCEQGDGSIQLVGFNQNILKDCVITVETYGTNE